MDTTTVAILGVSAVLLMFISALVFVCPRGGRRKGAADSSAAWLGAVTGATGGDGGSHCSPADGGACDGGGS